VTVLPVILYQGRGKVFFAFPLNYIYSNIRAFRGVVSLRAIKYNPD